MFQFPAAWPVSTYQTSSDINHFLPMFPFDTQWKHHKTVGFLMFSLGVFIKRQSCRHIETSQIFSADQLDSFYMMVTLAFNELRLAENFGK